MPINGVIGLKNILKKLVTIHFDPGWFLLFFFSGFLERRNLTKGYGNVNIEACASNFESYWPCEAVTAPSLKPLQCKIHPTEQFLLLTISKEILPVYAIAIVHSRALGQYSVSMLSLDAMHPHSGCSLAAF